MNTIVESMDEFLKKSSDSFEDFLLQCFKPYGITKENAKAYINRISVDCYSDLEHETTYRRYYLDGRYLFTIVSSGEMKEVDHAYIWEHNYQMIKERSKI